MPPKKGKGRGRGRGVQAEEGAPQGGHRHHGGTPHEMQQQPQVPQPLQQQQPLTAPQVMQQPPIQQAPAPVARPVAVPQAVAPQQMRQAEAIRPQMQAWQKPQIAAEQPKLPKAKQEVAAKVRDVTKELAKFTIEKAPVQCKMPKRPGFGTKGRIIKLIANHFEVEIPGGSVYHYDVEIEALKCLKAGETADPNEALTRATPQQVSGKRVKPSVARLVINQLKNGFREFAPYLLAYDGNKNLYTRRPLPFDSGRNFIVKFIEEGRDLESRFKVSIKPVEKDGTSWCEINMEALKAVFAGTVQDVSFEAIQALDVILRSGPAMKMHPLRASLFNIPRNPNDKKILSSGHEVWFGYYQSLRPGQWKPMLNIDKSSTTFYPSGPIINFISSYLNVNVDDIARLNPNNIRELNKELKNIQIFTNHMPTYKRKYRVFKMTTDRANQIKFEENKDGRTRKITVEQYFRENYKPLRYPNFPCLEVGSETKKVYLPLEVCDLVLGQHYRRKLQPTQTAEMIRFTATPPADRFQTIRDSVKEMHQYGREYMQEFGIKVATEPLHLEGRVLDAPTIIYKEGNRGSQITPRDGVWDMKDSLFYKGCVVEKWGILSLAGDRFCRPDMVEKFAKMLKEFAVQTGMQFPPASGILYKGPEAQRGVSIEKILIELLSKAGSLSLLVIVLGRNSNYGEIKQVAETKLGIMTQCIKDESIVKKCNPQLIINLLQKINAKMGGTNNSLSPSQKPEIFRRPVIIIGADVSHPSPGDKVKPSIAAAVGSVDSIPSRFSCVVKLQKNKDELQSRVEVILELKDMVKELLKAFHRNTGKKPEKIVFYRDGVSEGQFGEIQQIEVTQIRAACKELQADYEPGITFVVVGKRHHTRFMPENFRDGVGKHKNIPPGTMVDTKVSSPVDFDFFLCSHAGIQGTSRPAHYTVIWDDNNFNADDIQKLTYYLCHTYVRCTRSISIPAPVQYAHLAAFRAKYYLATLCDAGSSSSEDTYAGGEDFRLPANVTEAINVKDSIGPKMYYV